MSLELSPKPCPWRLALIVALPLALTGCFSSATVRIENASPMDFHEVELGDTFYGEIPAGTITDFKAVRLVPLLRYADLRLTVDGVRVSGQTLMHGSSRFTHRVDVVDLEAGHLEIDVRREPRDDG